METEHNLTRLSSFSNLRDTTWRAVSSNRPLLCQFSLEFDFTKVVLQNKSWHRVCHFNKVFGVKCMFLCHTKQQQQHLNVKMLSHPDPSIPCVDRLMRNKAHSNKCITRSRNATWESKVRLSYPMWIFIFVLAVQTLQSHFLRQKTHCEQKPAC